MFERGKINQAMITAGRSRFILSLLIYIIVFISPLIWIISGSRSGLGYIFGLAMAAIYYYMYFICTRLMKSKNIALGASFMLITYLIRLSVIALGLFLAFFVFELVPLFTVISFMISHGIIMLLSDGMTETFGFKSRVIWKEHQQSA